MEDLEKNNQKKIRLKKLWILRVTGLCLFIFSGYIVFYTMSGSRPRGYWKNINNVPDVNLYQNKGKFWDKNGNQFQLNKFIGQPAMVAFLYLNCNTACPRIMGELKSLGNALKEKNRKYHNIIVLFDDLRKDPKQINKFYSNYQVSESEWSVLTTSPQNLKELADQMKIRYDVVDDKKFIYVHTNLIAAVDKTGKVILADFGLVKESSDIMETLLVDE